VRDPSARRVDLLRKCRKRTSFAIDLQLNRFCRRCGTGFAMETRCNTSRARR